MPAVTALALRHHGMFVGVFLGSGPLPESSPHFLACFSPFGHFVCRHTMCDLSLNWQSYLVPLVTLTQYVPLLSSPRHHQNSRTACTSHG